VTTTPLSRRTRTGQPICCDRSNFLVQSTLAQVNFQRRISKRKSRRHTWNGFPSVLLDAHARILRGTGPMFRNHLGRWSIIAATLFVAGCNTCSDRPPLFSRFRTTSVVSGGCGGCCEGAVTGPYVPPCGAPGCGAPAAPPCGVPGGPPCGGAPGAMIPPQPLAQPPQPTIPRIDENGKQLPWDGKSTSQQGIKTSNGVQQYGAQPYGAQPYGAQPYGAQPNGAPYVIPKIGN
jgi:hypothetical protein